jgi:hypothetical protein
MKRKLWLLTLLLVFALASFSELIAQRQIISSREYSEAAYNRENKWYEKSRRVVSIDETFSNGAVTKSIMIVSEVLLPDKERFYSKSTSGNKVAEYERIKIDYMEYTRIDGGAWTKVDLRQTGGTGGLSTGSGSTSCDQYSVEATWLNSMSVQLFEALTIENKGNELWFRESRHWIGENKLPYQTEMVKGKFSPRDVTSRLVTTYEYDPAIKIEAPIK